MNKFILVLAVVLTIFGIAYVTSVKVTSDKLSGFTLNAPVQTGGTYQNFTFFSATTTSATSTNTLDSSGSFVVKGAKKVVLYFSRTGLTANAGSSTFNVQVSPDGTNYYDYSKLISNAANTNGQTLTRVASVAISAATSTTISSLDLGNEAFYSIRCIVVEATDGEHTCKASAEF